MRVGSFKVIVSGLIVSLGIQVSAQTDTIVNENVADRLMDSVSYQGDSINDSSLELVDVDKLDSLAFQTFFGDFVAIQDTNTLNIYGFEADEIPQYDDSVFIKRFEDLNRQTPIEFVYNKVVRNYINLYGYKNRKLTSKMLGLAKYYFPLFEEYLDKYDLPLELKYLAIVESALNPTAGSRAGAKGLWQFMYGTGRMYGLKSNSLVDDRYDPIKATEAACQHLQDLYDIYEDWSLALAAYNSGTGNVNKAIRRAGRIKSYWAVWPYLPRETRGYVPGFFGVAYVMQYSAEHNLYPEHPGFLYHQIDTVTVTDVLSFEQISEFLDISEKDLKTLNPSFKKSIIPATKDKPYVLYLPHDLIGTFVEKEKEIYDYVTKKGVKREKLLAEIKKASERSIHRVKSGENLGFIARKYRTSVRNLKKWNNLRSSMIYPGQKLIVYSPYTDNYLSSKKVKKSTNGTHVVKKGETLGMIAKAYRVKISELKKWNNLRSSTIYVNQRLKVKAS